MTLIPAILPVLSQQLDQLGLLSDQRGQVRWGWCSSSSPLSGGLSPAASVNHLQELRTGGLAQQFHVMKIH